MTGDAQDRPTAGGDADGPNEQGRTGKTAHRRTTPSGNRDAAETDSGRTGESATAERRLDEADDAWVLVVSDRVFDELQDGVRTLLLVRVARETSAEALQALGVDGTSGGRGARDDDRDPPVIARGLRLAVHGAGPSAVPPDVRAASPAAGTGDGESVGWLTRRRGTARELHVEVRGAQRGAFGTAEGEVLMEVAVLRETDPDRRGDGAERR